MIAYDRFGSLNTSFCNGPQARIVELKYGPHIIKARANDVGYNLKIKMVSKNKENVKLAEFRSLLSTCLVVIECNSVKDVSEFLIACVVQSELLVFSIILLIKISVKLINKRVVMIVEIVRPD